MFDNPTINIFIGFSLIFLLYSLLSTTLQEIIARWLGLRNRMLLKAIRRMLNDETSITWFKRITILTFIRECLMGLIRFFYPWFLDRRSFVKAFYDSPDIKYLGESTLNSKPTYIEASTFSQAIVNLLRGNNVSPNANQMELIRNRLFTTGASGALSSDKLAENKKNIEKKGFKQLMREFMQRWLHEMTYNTAGSIQGPDFIIKKETLATLRNYYTDAGGDLDKFKWQLEKWFEETMRRATGWYKKQTSLLLFMIGFGMAYYYNVDAVHIYRILSKDKVTQEKLVDLALKDTAKLGRLVTAVKPPEQKKGTPPVTTHGPSLEVNYKALQSDADEANQLMGIGHQKDTDFFQLGFFITALAISLGANFWFDMLSKFISLRAAGPKTTDNTATSKDPNTVKTVG